MRFLTWNNQGELVLTEKLVNNLPPYVILSHTWGKNSDEVTFADIQQHQGHDKDGYSKIRFCGEQAKKDEIDHFWVDTCCVDQTNPDDVREAIMSMYRWYRKSYKCYVYLSDVSADQEDINCSTLPAWEQSFRSSRWFTRSWTLQELLAPTVVEFFSRDAKLLGTKETLTELIHDVTNIPIAALQGTHPSQFAISERIRWTKRRDAQRVEDKAYSLLGIFDVYMSPWYGEGKTHAFERLRRKINYEFGGNVADGLGDVDEVETLESQRILKLSDGKGNSADGALDINQEMQALQPDSQRPTKRTRMSYANITEPSKMCAHDNATFNTALTGVADYQYQNSGQISEHNSVAMDKDKYDILFKSLPFDRIDFRVNNVKKALLSTCEWLFRHSHFQKWYQQDSSAQHSGFLWIRGKPGCGKSMLMKAALGWARMQNKKHCARKTIIPYFFNARASASLEKSSLGLYRTIVHHLLSSYPQLHRLFTETFARTDPGLTGENWTVEELQGFLDNVVELNDQNYPIRLCLFIDALDEAEHESDVRQMISFLVQLSDRAIDSGGSCRLQICLSSRHYPHISIGRGFAIVVEDQPEHGHDIDKYIAKQLTCSDSPEKDDLRVKIFDKSAHIFLWVVLVVDILNSLDDRGASLPEMLAHLETIPAGLDELFHELITRSNHGIEASMLLFQWMIFRMRPLEPAELFVAMAYSKSPDDPSWSLSAEFSVPLSDRLDRSLLEYSRGLVEVVKIAPSQPKVVQFIHETVRDFLLNKNGLSSVNPALATNLAGISHEILRIACFRCIKTIAIPEQYKDYGYASHKTHDLLKQFKSQLRLELPFLEYAVQYLFDHADQAHSHGISQQQFLTSHISTNGLLLDSYRLWWNIFERYKSRKFQPEMPLILFCIERQCLNLLSVVHGFSNFAAASYKKHKNPLSFASSRGFPKVVRLLTDLGADVNAYGGEALYVASRHGSNEVMQVLIDAGANANIQTEDGSAIHTAIMYGHITAVRNLINAGANVNIQTGSGSALYAAVEWNRTAITQTLIDASADVNTQGGYHGTALQAASYWGNTEIVQVLIDAGADVNAEGGYHGTALKAASYRGNTEIVQILIDTGADVNAEGGHHGTALQAALCNDRGEGTEITQLLLKHGAKPR